MRFDNVLLVSTQSAAGNVTSSPIILESLYGFSMQAVFTGSIVGSLKLQGSCDQGTSQAGAGVTNWSDIGGSTQAITAPQVFIYNIDAVYYRWVRVVYTATSGAGNITVRFNGKGV